MGQPSHAQPNPLRNRRKRTRRVDGRSGKSDKNGYSGPQIWESPTLLLAGAWASLTLAVLRPQESILGSEPATLPLQGLQRIGHALMTSPGAPKPQVFCAVSAFILGGRRVVSRPREVVGAAVLTVLTGLMAMC